MTAAALRVLVVEDSESDSLLLVRELRRSDRDIVWERVDTAGAMRSALEREPWDIVVSDYRLPHFSAPQALDLLKSTGLDLPFIIVSGEVGEDVAVEAMKAGAHDFFVKGNFTRLMSAIERELDHAAERWARRKVEDDNTKLAAIVQSSDDSIIALRLDGIITAWNGAAERLFGYSAQEAIGQSIGILVPADRVGEIAEILERIGQGKSISNFETVRLRKDGTRIDVSLSVSPMRNSSGEVIGTSAFARDITLRKRADESIQKLVRAVEQTKNAIFMTDTNGAISYVNPAFEELYGYSQPETLGKTPRILKSGQQDRAFYDRFWQRLLAGESVRQEFRNTTRDGRTVIVENTVSPVLDAQGQRIGFIAVQDDVTDRRRAERALQLSERRFRALVENGLDFISLLAADGTLLWESPGAIRPLGYPPNAHLGRNILELVHPDDADWVRQALAEVVQEPVKPQQGVFRLRRGDGSWCWVEASAVNRLLDESVKAIVVNYRDITERKRAEDELRVRAAEAALVAEVATTLTNGEELHAMLHGSAEAVVRRLDAAVAQVWLLDAAHTALELAVSAGLDLHHGALPVPVPVGQFKIGRIASERRPHVSNDLAHDREFGDASWAVDNGLVSFAGHPLVVHDRVVGVATVLSRYAFSDSTVQALASVARTLALGIARHQSVQELRTLEERTRFALQNANVGIWDFQPPTGALQWSAIVEAQHGLTPGTFGGTLQAFLDRIHPDDRESVRTMASEAAKSGLDFTVPYRAIWPDGSVRWLITGGRFHLDAHGEAVRAIGISQDFTERHMLEGQYQQAQKMEAVGRLAGGVAHDFNNLLTAILGYCELLLADFHLGDPRRADLDEIRKAGVLATVLTRQLLAFSRKQIIEPTLLDLHEIVAEMRPMLGRLIEEHVTIAVGRAPERALVMADRGQVEQVILNLVVNARDAMPKGGVLTIETADIECDESYLRMHPLVKPGRYVTLAVTDTGTGMTPDVQAHLFEPFFTTKELGKGTGLGLATVHGAVTRLGGHIDVRSEIGKGSSFKVYFPRATVDNTVAEPRPPLASPAGAAQTILLVEDEDGLRNLCRRLLRQQGHTVLAAATGIEALRMFEEHGAIDMLLTDVIMPGMSGPDLARRLLERRPALKVLYMSGYTDDTLANEGTLNAAVTLLVKPFTAEALARKIEEVSRQ